MSSRVLQVTVLIAIFSTHGSSIESGAQQDPQIWDPPAIVDSPEHSKTQSMLSLIQAGRRLFQTQFNLLDGAGRPLATGDSKPTYRSSRIGRLFSRVAGPDANSCAGCHNRPTAGGSGDFAANVFVGAHFTDPPTTSVLASITSERNTPSLFGLGAIELLAREMTRDLHKQRYEALESARKSGKSIAIELKTKGVGFGYLTARPDGTFDSSKIAGIDTDLVVKPFGAKGVAVSLREFTVFALNQHHGIQATERFGWQRTGRIDFDEDGVEVEFTIGQLSALTLFQASLPSPIQESHGVDHSDEIDEGKRLFDAVGCSSCHVQSLPLGSNVFTEPNPFNRPGAATPADVSHIFDLRLPTRTDGSGLYVGPDGGLWVAAYTDLKRHSICDQEVSYFCNERVRQDLVPTDYFMTARLWDIGSSAPYGHRGDLTTISEAIIHHGGEARDVRRKFLALESAEKAAVVTFLRSLKIPSDTTLRKGG